MAGPNILSAEACGGGGSSVAFPVSRSISGVQDCIPRACSGMPCAVCGERRGSMEGGVPVGMVVPTHSVVEAASK